VAFLGNGWSTYAMKEYKNIVLLDDNLDLEKAANAYVNPLTACGMIHFAKSVNAKAIV
jgi:NADPH:quinone reductase-like Zn-dependent oxidoreductase